MAAIMLLVVPFVAERTVPGDTLYAVKVHFNEEVRSTLTLDSYQKVEWETTRLNRRIAEAKLLEKEGLLTEEVGAEVAAAVKQHTDNAKAEIETLRETDADNAAIAAIELDSTLAIQAQALTNPTVELLNNEVSTTTEAAATLIADAIDESIEGLADEVALPSLEKLIARVEQHTTRVRELEQTILNQVDADTATDITRRIEDVERVAAEALALDDEAEAEAQEILIDVITRAQKLVVFMTELELREDIAISTAVPVILTSDEENSNRSERLTTLNKMIQQISATEVEDADLAAKIAVFSEQLTAAQTSLASIPDEVYETFVAESDAALVLGRDALLLLEQAGLVVASIVPTAPATATSTSATTTDQLPDQEQATSTVATTTPSDDQLPEEQASTTEAVADVEVVETLDEQTETSFEEVNTEENIDEL